MITEQHVIIVLTLRSNRVKGSIATTPRMHAFLSLLILDEFGGAKYTFLSGAVAIGRYTISHTYYLKSMFSQYSILKLYKNQIENLLVNRIEA